MDSTAPTLTGADLYQAYVDARQAAFLYSTNLSGGPNPLLTAQTDAYLDLRRYYGQRYSAPGWNGIERLLLAELGCINAVGTADWDRHAAEREAAVAYLAQFESFDIPPLS